MARYEDKEGRLHIICKEKYKEKVLENINDAWRYIKRLKKAYRNNPTSKNKVKLDKGYKAYRNSGGRRKKSSL